MQVWGLALCVRGWCIWSQSLVLERFNVECICEMLGLVVDSLNSLIKQDQIWYSLSVLQRIARDRLDAEHWFDYGTFNLYINDIEKAEECFKVIYFSSKLWVGWNWQYPHTLKYGLERYLPEYFGYCLSPKSFSTTNTDILFLTYLSLKLTN